MAAVIRMLGIGSSGLALASADRERH